MVSSSVRSGVSDASTRRNEGYHPARREKTRSRATSSQDMVYAFLRRITTQKHTSADMEPSYSSLSVMA